LYKKIEAWAHLLGYASTSADYQNKRAKDRARSYYDASPAVFILHPL